MINEQSLPKVPSQYMFLHGVCKYGSQGLSLDTFSPASVPGAAPWAPQPSGECIPQGSSLAQRRPLSLGSCSWTPTRQCWGCISPLCQGMKLRSLARRVLSLTLLVPTFQPLLATGPSFPLCQIISLSQITTAEKLQLGFLLCLLFVNRQEE